MSETFIAELPEWDAPGSQPAADKMLQGFQPDESPAAGHFDWFFNRVYLALKELHESGASLDDLDTLNQAITATMTQYDIQAQGYANTAEVNAHTFTSEQVSTVQQDLNLHKSDLGNPHSTTKDQVGLGNVKNYGIASQSDAQTGTNDAVYMTALKVAQAISTLQAIKSVNSKTGNVTLSAGDVGAYLKAEADSKFETPSGSQTKANAVQTDLNAHKNNTANPHSTTAAQVGAYSKLESDGKYETPAGAQSKVNTHTNLTNNPHRVTAAQVGAETPTGAQAKVNTHANLTNNPHSVTAAQVGAETPTGAQAKVNAHANLTNNPHSVTAAQVGAETPAGSQSKANTAESNAKNYALNLHGSDVLDTRSDNDSPLTYMNQSGGRTINEFKYRSTIGAPGATTYGLLVTNAQWSSSSGGYPSQVFYSIDGIFYRHGINDTTWSGWLEQESTSGSQAKANTVQANLNSHTGDKTNPHNVTAAQIGALLASQYTAADVLAKLKSVDGSGSGVDADLLDGHDSSYFETPSGAQNRANTAQTNAINASENWVRGFGLGGTSKDITGTNLNTLYDTGFYKGNALTNAPTSGWFHIINLEHASTYITQIALSLNLANQTMYIRTNVGGNWASWFQYETTEGSTAKMNNVTGSLQFHESQQNNPHSVTAAQTGAYSKSETYAKSEVDSLVKTKSTLWTGASYMDGSNTVIYPTKKLSECTNGWILVWSDYDAGVGSNDFDFNYTFVHKNVPILYSNAPSIAVVGTYFNSTTTALAEKAYHVYDDKLVGSDGNTGDGRNDVVLRNIIEF